MNLSANEIDLMRAGTVIHRFLTKRNAHRKFVVFEPTKYINCDDCNLLITSKGVKIESNGGKIRGSFCSLCAIDRVFGLTE